MALLENENRTATVTVKSPDVPWGKRTDGHGDFTGIFGMFGGEVGYQ